MPAPVFRPNATAVITGAASGIGLALAHHCAKSGMNLLLLDLDTISLFSLSSEYPSLTIRLHSGDVSAPATWTAAAEVARAEFPSVDGLFLNAGTAVNPTRGVTDVGAFEKTFATNVFGVVLGLAAFLPLIKKSDKEGRVTAVVVTGSKQGITNPPGNPAYNASKAAVKSLTEGLALEMEKEGGKTGVHLLVPGWTFTGMTGAKTSGDKPAGAWLPEQVVAYLDGKMTEGKFYAICPDGEVDEEMDKRRMLWTIGDVVYGRPALSRWREATRVEAAEEIKKLEI